MKVLIVLSFILAASLATPVDQVEIQVEKLEDAPVANEPVGILVGNTNLPNLVGASNVANLTAIIQQLVKEEISKILLSLQSAKNFTLSSLISSDEPAEQKPLEVDIKQEDQPAAAVQQQDEPKPVFFLPRRPGYFAPPHPFFYSPQQPYYNSQPYPFYPRGEERYGSPGGPQWRRINPTNDEGLTDLEALAELELLLNEKDGPIGDVEGRGLMSSISTTTNSAKSSFKSFINSLSAALPSFSVVRKTYLVPGLAING